MSGCYPGCFYYTDSCFRKDCFMETHIVHTDESGRTFNRFRQEVIKCAFYSDCDRLTTMTGSQLCDGCYNLRREPSDLYYVHVLPTQAEIDAGPHGGLGNTPEDYRRRTVLFDCRDELTVKAAAGDEIWASMRQYGRPDRLVDRRGSLFHTLNGRTRPVPNPKGL